MKKFVFLFLACIVCQWAAAQSVLTIVYAVSDDGFVNVHSQPELNSPVIGQIHEMFEGLGDATYLATVGEWTKVQVGRHEGYVKTKYVGFANYYQNNGSPKLVTIRDNTPIYAEDLSGENRKLIFAKVKAGTILSDNYTDEGEYYWIQTAHTCLYVSKSNVKEVE